METVVATFCFPVATTSTPAFPSTISAMASSIVATTWMRKTVSSLKLEEQKQTHSQTAGFHAENCGWVGNS